MPQVIDRCHVCGGSTYQPRYRFVDCSIVRCNSCGFMWLNPQPSEDDVGLIYDESYYSNVRFFDKSSAHLYGYADYAVERINKQIQFDKLVTRAKAIVAPEAGQNTAEGETPTTELRWLDIGCGLGYLLDCAYDHGFEVVGIEFNRHAIEKLHERYNFRVENEPVFHKVFDREAFDVISMTDVIEHLHDPRATFQRMFELTRPGGVAVITTIDSASLTSRWLGRRLEDFRRTREHLYFFSRTTMRRLLGEAGYRVVRIHSYGHTFELGFLAERIGLISEPLGKVVQGIVHLLKLKKVRLYLDPRTKMIIYAEKPR